MLTVGLVWFAIPVLLFPAVTGADLTPSLMNWASLTWGGALLLAGLWYFLRARHRFTGPQIQHLKEPIPEKVGLEAPFEQKSEYYQSDVRPAEL